MACRERRRQREKKKGHDESPLLARPALLAEGSWVDEGMGI
jgi:hypothetical protein